MPSLTRDPSPTPIASVVEPAPAYPLLAVLLGRLMDIAFHAVAFLIPLVVCTAAQDAVELPKQTVLVAAAAVAAIAWIGRVVAEKRVAITRNWVHLVAVVWLVAYAVLSFTSVDRGTSLWGSMGQASWSFATMASLVVLYSVLVNRVRSTTQVYNLLFSFLLGSGLAAGYGVLQLYAGTAFSFGIAGASGVTTIGTVFALSMLASVTTVIAAGLAFHGCKNHVCALGEPGVLGNIARGITVGSGILSLLVLVRVDFWGAWLAVLVGTVCTVLMGFWKGGRLFETKRLIAPAFLALVSLVMLFVRLPWPTTVPGELAPSAKASWLIAQSALKEHPVLGTGPGTWVYSYAKYRVQIINESPLWNVRFERGSSAFLTLLATIGILGVSLWVLLLGSVLVKTIAHYREETNEDVQTAIAVVSGGWIALAFSGFVYNYNVAHQTVFWLLLALLGALMTRQVLVWDGRKAAGTSGAFGIAFLIITVVACSSAWVAGQRMYAERVFTQALRTFQGGATIDTVLPEFERAVSLNAASDLYLRNLSQALLVKASLLMKDGATPDVFANQVRPIVARLIELGIRARELNPSNVDNWSNLAFLYQSIASFSAGADEHAIKQYREAAVREPNNPVYLTEVGKLYILRADAYRAQLQAKDPKAVEIARASIAENLRDARAALEEATQLMGTFFPARYHLAVVNEREGRIGDAIAQLTAAAQTRRSDAGLAFELAMLHYRSSYMTQDVKQRAARQDAARQLLDQIAGFDPSRVNARWYLAALHEERGEGAQAIGHLEALMKLVSGPERELVKAKLEAFKKQSPKAGPRPMPEPLRERVVTDGQSGVR